MPHRNKFISKLTRKYYYLRTLKDWGYSIAKNSDIQCKLPKSTKILHKGIGVIIGCNVKIGDNCVISQNINIGGRVIMGSNVRTNPYVVIFGDLRIGDNVIIGSFSYVDKDIPSDSKFVRNEIKPLIKENVIKSLIKEIEI